MLSLLLLPPPVAAAPAATPPEGAEPEAPPEGAPAASEQPPPLVRMPALTGFVEAPYPPEALEAGVEGTVLLLLDIDATGAVTEVQVLEDPGWGMGEAAAEAARSFRFTPAEDAEGPVPVQVEFRYGFSLEAPAEAPEQAPEAAPINLDGVVRERGTGRPLAGVTVRLDGLEEVITDADGRFAFRGVPAGVHRLVAVGPAHLPAEVEAEVRAGEATSVRIWIRPEEAGEAVGVYRRPGEDITRRTLSVEQVRRIPGTFGDPVRVVQNLPGAARSPFGTGLLVIRGSSPEDSAVYVDGIRIPFIYHLGGFVSVINGDLVESVDYLPGGYGVRYGRSMGGVVDVRTRRTSPDRLRATWSTDLLDTGALLEGRIGGEEGVHAAAAARVSYVDRVLDVAMPFVYPDAPVSARPRWMDYQLRLHHPGRTSWTLFWFGFEDRLEVVAEEDAPLGTDPDAQGRFALAYGTHRGLLAVERELAPGLVARLTPSIGIDTNRTELGQAFDLDLTQVLLEVRAEVDWQATEGLGLAGGVDFIGGWYHFTFGLPFDPDTLVTYDPLAEREPATLEGEGTGWGPDPYLQAAWRPLADREALEFVPGIRLTYVNIPGQYDDVALDPRLAVRARPLPRAHLKAGIGVYHQPPQPFESWSPAGDLPIGMERALAASLGWEHELPWGFTAEVEGFYKKMDDLLVDNPDLQGFDDPLFVNGGIGRVYGVETLVGRDPPARLHGWISYTLSRSERNDDPEGEGAWVPFDFDQTHILVALAALDLPRDTGVSGRFRYVTGNPYTPYAGGVFDLDHDFYWGIPSAEVNSERLPPFWALDLRAEKRFLFRRGSLELYLDLLNVLRGENPEFVQYNYDYTESRMIRGLPFLPSPGFELEFRL